MLIQHCPLYSGLINQAQIKKKRLIQTVGLHTCFLQSLGEGKIFQAELESYLSLARCLEQS